jgi:thiol:disulfide interchange protein DsbA
MTQDRHMTRIAALAFALSVASVAGAQPMELGRQYRMVEPAVATAVKPGQIEVIEFFSIGCPHCAEFEPFLQSWLKRKPGNVKFTRIPATFNPFFKLLGRAFYALEDLKASERALPLLYDAIHTKRNPDLLRPLGEYNARAAKNDPTGMAAAEAQVLDALTMFLASEAGMDSKKFRSAWNSFSMNTRLAQADTMMRKYGVRGVPGVAVNGKYFTGPGRPLAIRDFDEMIKTMDHLVALESKPAR